MSSILTGVKKQLGIDESYEHFDPDIIACVNAAFLSLYQVGGTSECAAISSKDDQWEDVLGDGNEAEACKMYIALKARMMFDPPTSSALTEAINASIKELEWRIAQEASEWHL